MEVNAKNALFSRLYNFVIHPPILTFPVFKIANLSPHWLQIKFSMSLFFYLFTFAISLWHQKFLMQQTSLQRLATINMVFSDDDKILIKSFYLKGYTAESFTEEFPEKRWIKRGVGHRHNWQAARQRQTAQWKENSYVFVRLIFQTFW